jgi:hypothetical protein
LGGQASLRFQFTFITHTNSRVARREKEIKDRKAVDAKLKIVQSLQVE